MCKLQDYSNLVESNTEEPSLPVQKQEVTLRALKARFCRRIPRQSCIVPSNCSAQAENGSPVLARPQEFRPFIRRLPEFKFWYTVVRATLFAIIATYIPVFNIPVCWQILVSPDRTLEESRNKIMPGAVSRVPLGWLSDVSYIFARQVMYFVMLFFMTMRRQIMDMKRFKYVPWDIGRKKKYRSSVSVTSPSPSMGSDKL